MTSESQDVSGKLALRDTCGLSDKTHEHKSSAKNERGDMRMSF